MFQFDYNNDKSPMVLTVKQIKWNKENQVLPIYWCFLNANGMGINR